MPNFYNILRARKFSTAADTALEIAPHDSATPNFAIDAGGKLSWSSGSANADTNLYRSAANTLKTDDSFDIASGKTYKIDGTDVLTATTLGSGIVNSSLTTVGTISSLQATSPNFNGTATFNGGNFTLDAQGNASFYGSLSSATPSFTGPFTSSGVSSFTNTVQIQQSLEKTNPLGNISGTMAIDLLTAAVHTGTGTGAFSFNFRGNGSNTLNSIMTNNQSITSVVMVTNTTAYTLSQVTIDGSAQTVKWFGGSAPSGNANSVDIYTFTIIKTASNTYTVFGSQSKFA